jgi:hypothetical protein
MKAGGGVIVTGDKALDALLATLPMKMQKKVFRKGIRPVVRSIVLPAAQSNVPSDTGALRGSLKLVALKSNVVSFTRSNGKAGKRNLNANKVGVQVMTADGFYKGDQFYGAFTEFGTKERKHKSGKNVGKVEEVGWLRKSVYENEQQVKSSVLAAVTEQIRELKAGPIK